MGARVCKLVSLAFLALVTVLILGLPAQAATTFSGRAFAAFVNTAITGPVYFSDTGQLPSGGGQQGASLLTVNQPGVLSAEVLVASTSGGNSQANSSASLAEVVVLQGTPYQVTASFVRAQVEADCSGVSGSSEIANLTFGGQSVTVSGAPNQTIILPGGLATLIINEQSTTTNGKYQQIDVSAIHLIVPGVGEVILSSAHSDIKCNGNVKNCFDFVTGGGWITVVNSRANFGFHAGINADGSFRSVHLNFIDHSNGMKVHANSMTSYSMTSSNCRHVTGACEINGHAGFTYAVDVCDNGEPGRADTFSILLSNGYSSAGTLAGGNIQLHNPCGGKP
jgi:hypothetical protein